MMLAKLLGDDGKKAKSIATKANLTLRLDTSGAKITRVHLITEVNADGLDAAGLQRVAERRGRSYSGAKIHGLNCKLSDHKQPMLKSSAQLDRKSVV